MRYTRMPIEVESPEESGYGNLKCNLVESSIADQSLGDLHLSIPDLKLQYTEHRGNQRLRELVVADELQLTSRNVMITTGTAGALFIVATTLLTSNDHLLIVRPNYAINLATPQAIGSDITYLDLKFEEKFRVDLSAVRNAIRPDTRLISITNPHNPSGQVMSKEELANLARLAKEKGCYLLVDEIYKDVTFGEKLPIAASLGEHVISVGSLSKCFGVPGTRIGWLINQNPRLLDTFLAAKEQINICGSVVDEWIAEKVLSNRTTSLSRTTEEMKARLELVSSWVAQEDYLEWIRPQGGMVCILHMVKQPVGGPAAFYRRLVEQHGVHVAPGRWFELEDSYFRVGLGWPTVSELRYGLEKISEALRG